VSLANIPAILKHMALAIWTDGSLGRGVAGLKAAWLVACARLVEYGYLAAGAESGSLERIRLTVQGVSQNRKHLREGTSKNRRFDQIFDVILSTQADAPPGGTDAAKETKAPPPGVGKEPIATPQAPMGKLPKRPNIHTDLGGRKKPGVGRTPRGGKP
jgi:hypothetical protein